MPAPYPRCLYAGIVISVKFTVANAEVLIQTFEQTERRDARASFTFPMFWDVSTALIGTVDPARSAARGAVSDTGRRCDDLGVQRIT